MPTVSKVSPSKRRLVRMSEAGEQLQAIPMRPGGCMELSEAMEAQYKRVNPLGTSQSYAPDTFAEEEEGMVNGGLSESEEGLQEVLEQLAVERTAGSFLDADWGSGKLAHALAQRAKSFARRGARPSNGGTTLEERTHDRFQRLQETTERTFAVHQTIDAQNMAVHIDSQSEDIRLERNNSSRFSAAGRAFLLGEFEKMVGAACKLQRAFRVFAGRCRAANSWPSQDKFRQANHAIKVHARYMEGVTPKTPSRVVQYVNRPVTQDAIATALRNVERLVELKEQRLAEDRLHGLHNLQACMDEGAQSLHAWKEEKRQQWHVDGGDESDYPYESIGEYHGRISPAIQDTDSLGSGQHFNHTGTDGVEGGGSGTSTPRQGGGRPRTVPVPRPPPTHQPFRAGGNSTPAWSNQPLTRVKPSGLGGGGAGGAGGDLARHIDRGDGGSKGSSLAGDRESVSSAWRPAGGVPAAIYRGGARPAPPGATGAFGAWRPAGGGEVMLTGLGGPNPFAGSGETTADRQRNDSGSTAIDSGSTVDSAARRSGHPDSVGVGCSGGVGATKAGRGGAAGLPSRPWKPSGNAISPAAALVAAARTGDLLLLSALQRSSGSTVKEQQLFTEASMPLSNNEVGEVEGGGPPLGSPCGCSRGEEDTHSRSLSGRVVVPQESATDLLRQSLGSSREGNSGRVSGSGGGLPVRPLGSISPLGSPSQMLPPLVPPQHQGGSRPLLEPVTSLGTINIARRRSLAGGLGESLANGPRVAEGEGGGGGESWDGQLGRPLPGNLSSSSPVAASSLLPQGLNPSWSYDPNYGAIASPLKPPSLSGEPSYPHAIPSWTLRIAGLVPPPLLPVETSPSLLSPARGLRGGIGMTDTYNQSAQSPAAGPSELPQRLHIVGERFSSSGTGSQRRTDSEGVKQQQGDGCGFPLGSPASPHTNSLNLPVGSTQPPLSCQASGTGSLLSTVQQMVMRPQMAQQRTSVSGSNSPSRASHRLRGMISDAGEDLSRSGNRGGASSPMGRSGGTNASGAGGATTWNNINELLDARNHVGEGAVVGISPPIRPQIPPSLVARRQGMLELKTRASEPGQSGGR